MSLASLTLVDVAAIGIGWGLLAAALCTVPHRLRRNRKAAEAERVNWIPELPPVPAPRSSEESWLDLVPADCLVDDDPILHSRFWDLVDSERWFA